MIRMVRSEEVKCEKCGSTDGSVLYHTDGAVSKFSCTKCGHLTVYYHITEKGREVLRRLLGLKE